MSDDEIGERASIQQRAPSPPRSGARAPKSTRAKPGKKKTASSAPARVSASPRDRFDKLESDLIPVFNEWGAELSLVLPVSGMVFADRAKTRARTWRRMAERNAHFMDFAEKVAAGGIITAFLGDICAVGIAVAVDFGRLEGEGRAAKMFDVTPVYQIVVEEEEREAEEQRQQEAMSNGAIPSDPARRPSFLE